MSLSLVPKPSTLVAATRFRLLSIPSWVLVTELFIGAGWLRAWAEKAMSLEWWRGESLATFLDTTADARVPWFHLDHGTDEYGYLLLWLSHGS